MQLTAILLTICCLSVTARTVSQTVTYTGKDVRLETVFAAIKEQTGYFVLFEKGLASDGKPLSVNAKDMSLEDFLDEILKGQPFTYSLKKTTITIARKMQAANARPQLSSSLNPPPISVRGRIMNEKNEPVVASITVKGTVVGTVSGIDGAFQLQDVPSDGTLIISGINIETKEIKVNNRSDIVISIVTRIAAEEEVTISTGYWTTTKERTTANIAKVTSKDIEKQPVTSPLASLQGRMPGVDIQPTTGAPGSAMKIRIRGQNSLRVGGAEADGNLPLYVVDGVPINPSPIKTANFESFAVGFDPLSSINPANIESIDVLKDAAATSIYGSRGANGVVLITTKKGKVGKTTFDVNAYSGVGNLTNRLKLLNTQEYLNMRNEALQNDGLTPQWYDYDINGTWDTSRYTDWQDVMLGNTSKIHDIQAGFSGGNNNTTFRIFGGYHKEGTIFPKKDFGYNSVTGSLNLSHISNNRKLTISFNANYGSTKNNLYVGNIILTTALFTPPHAPNVYNENGEYNWQIIETPFGLVNSWENPFARLARSHTIWTTNLVTTSTVGYDIIKGLSAKVRMGYSSLNSHEDIISPFSSLSPTSINPSTVVASIFGNNRRTTTLIEPQIQYTKGFDYHEIQVNVGVTLQEDKGVYQTIQASGYKSDALLRSTRGATRVSFTADEDDQYRYNALYGRLGYSFKNKILADVSLRRDGSSKFGPGHRFGNFGAIGLGWIFTKERFIEDKLQFISYGKIRSSLGTTGNDQIGNFQYLNTYSVSFGRYQDATNIYPNALFNPNLAWESTKKLELAVEMGFLKNRINIEVALFKNRSSNLLISQPLALTTGFNTITNNFGATVQNSGVEISLFTKNIEHTNFTWNTSFNISFLRNELVKFDGIENSPYALTNKIGEPLSITKGYVWKGIDPATGLHIFEDFNGNGYTDDGDLAFMKPMVRNYFGGIQNRLIYKGFELAFLVQFVDQTARKYEYNTPGFATNQPHYILDRWQKPGDITNIAKFNSNGALSTNISNALNSSYNIGDGSFMRVKTATFTFNFGQEIAQNIGLQSLSIFAQAQNLLTWAKSKDAFLDPETGNNLPPLKIISLGLQVKL